MALAPDSDLWNYYTNFKEEGVAECKLCKQRLKNSRSYNLKLHIKKVHKNRAEIDKYFVINVLENIAICRTCNHQLKNRLCNIILHMRRLHNIEISVNDDKPVEYAPPPQPYNEDQIQAVLKVAKRKMAEQVAHNGKRSAHRLFIRMDKRTIMRSVLGLIVEDGVSPHLFSSKHFEAILRPICESIADKQAKEFRMNEADIERIINLMGSSIRNDFSNDLSWRLLTIKIDNDLDALQNVFCVRAVFREDGAVQNRALGLIELKADTELHEDHIKRVLHKFNIDSNQIISVCWDNAQSRHKNQIPNSGYLKEVEMFKSFPQLQFSDVKIEPYLGSVAQVCLLNILQNSKIMQPFLKCRNLVKFLNDQRNGYCRIFDANETSLPRLDSPLNAGSTCQMMNDLWEARSLLQNVKFEKPLEAADHFECNAELWSFIEAFCMSTNYLQKTISKYNNEELHIGDFYAQWLKCKLLTQKFAATHINNVSQFFPIILGEILKSMENITKQLLEKEHVTACLYLDPRFQRILNAAEKNTAVGYLKRLWCRSKLYIDDGAVLKNVGDPLFEDDEDAFLNEFLSHDSHVKDEASSDVFQKIDGLTLTFQTADTNVLSFWRGLKASEPEIYTLCAICFAIPATEICTKTRYSQVYRLNAKSQMSAFTKENLLCLRLNAHLLDDSLAQLHLIYDEHSICSPNSSDSEADSCEISEEGNSNTASASGEVAKLSNVDLQSSFLNVSSNKVKIEVLFGE